MSLGLAKKTCTGSPATAVAIASSSSNGSASSIYKSLCKRTTMFYSVAATRRRTKVLALAENKPEGSTQEDDTSEMLSIFGMEKAAESTFQLKFVWGSDTLAFAVDQVLGRGNSSPLTEYFFWPQDDAWENLKAVLESKDWIPASEEISMLNRVTEVINFWTPAEGEEQKSTDQAKAKFQDCGF